MSINIPIRDNQLANECMKQIKKENPRKQNWESPHPCSNNLSGFDVSVISHGRYSSKCRYIRYSYRPYYQSVIHLDLGNQEIKLVQLGKIVRQLKAPSGLRFGQDNNGFYVMSKDGMEYHPTVEDIKAKDFARRVRAKISENRQRRKEVRQEEREFERLAKKVNVTLLDSRLAGNCIHGTLNYLSSKYKLERDAVIRSHSFIPAKKLDLKDNRVKGAVLAAIRRETMVSI